MATWSFAPSVTKISHVIVNLKTNWLQHPRDQWKHQSRVFLALESLPPFFPLLTTLFALVQNSFFGLLKVTLDGLRNREFEIPRWRRPRKRRLKSEFAFFQSLSRLLQLIYFVKSKWTVFEPIPKNPIQVQKEKENLTVVCLREIIGIFPS